MKLFTKKFKQGHIITIISSFYNLMLLVGQGYGKADLVITWDEKTLFMPFQHILAHLKNAPKIHSVMLQYLVKPRPHYSTVEYQLHFYICRLSFKLIMTWLMITRVVTSSNVKGK